MGYASSIVCICRSKLSRLPPHVHMSEFSTLIQCNLWLTFSVSALAYKNDVFLDLIVLFAKFINTCVETQITAPRLSKSCTNFCCSLLSIVIIHRYI